MSSPSNSASAPMPHVVVVEDDELVAVAIEEGLSDAGFRVSVASDGAEALATLESGAADALLTDLHMPDMNGCELVEVLRARWPDLPVVALTGDQGLRDDTAGLSSQLSSAGIAVLTKPVELDRLAEAIRTALDA